MRGLNLINFCDESQVFLYLTSAALDKLVCEIIFLFSPGFFPSIFTSTEVLPKHSRNFTRQR